MSFLARIHPENPQQKQLESIAKTLQDGGVVIIPTDTVYALACSSTSSKGLDKMTRIKGKDFGNNKFSFVFEDLSQLSAFTKQFDTPTYKLLKRALPGPYTFIMESSNALSKLFKNKKKTIGIRVPNNKITRQLTQLVGSPLAVTSFHIDDDILEYSTNAELIFEEMKDQVDAVIDGGIGTLTPSTIIDLTGNTPEVIREGLGSLDVLN